MAKWQITKKPTIGTDNPLGGEGLLALIGAWISRGGAPGVIGVTKKGKKIGCEGYGRKQQDG
jgi:hypothetical protein